MKKSKNIIDVIDVSDLPNGIILLKGDGICIISFTMHGTYKKRSSFENEDRSVLS